MTNALKIISSQKSGCWINPYKLPFDTVDAVSSLAVSDADISDAAERLLRFAPFIKKRFPETAETDGIIESPLRETAAMKNELCRVYGANIYGRLFLKMDSHLAIAGSVKARGGIYEVLKHAEKLALDNGMLKLTDNYEIFAEDKMRSFLSQYTVQVGSTGNLGLSIGIISAALGFKVKIHMSADAKQWKKDLLRSKGAEVIEYSGDYSLAVEKGRKNSLADPKSYFVDDEYSKDLFLGYAVAAKRLKTQLDAADIAVDKDHPLFVYLPAGVGGAPGGICYGLKRLYGDNVHCFFAEPVLFPSVMLGIATQKHEKVDVREYGIGTKTEADGLACAKPSGFVTRIMTNHVSGFFTVKDSSLYDYLRLLDKTENIRIEPSSCAAFEGPLHLADSAADYLESCKITEEMLKNSVHISWATGGSLVPREISDKYLETHIND